ncbi:hypothetical protein HN51_035442 [Arachis hypogaea]
MPNLRVDSNFYLLSDDPSTRHSLRPAFVLTRRMGLVVKLPSVFALESQSPSDPRKLLHAFITFWRPTPYRNCLPETVPWPVGPDIRLEF